MIMFTIRAMSANDISVVIPMHLEYDLASWSEPGYLNELANSDSRCIVAEFDSKIVGFAVMRLISIEDLAHLLNIAVSVSFRGTGVGQLLLSSLIAETERHGIHKIYLEVRKENQSARRFYLKNHFKEIALSKNFYSSPPDDAVVMIRENCSSDDQETKA
jgi:ribosomal-protein-alanine N-acetyltransferase